MSNNLLVLGRALISEAQQPARRGRNQSHSAGELAAFDRAGRRHTAFPHPRMALPGQTRAAAE